MSRTGRIGNERSSGSFASFGCMLRSERDFSGIFSLSGLCSSLMRLIPRKMQTATFRRRLDSTSSIGGFAPNGCSKKFPQRAGFQHSA